MNFSKKDTGMIKGIAILLLLFYHLFAQSFVYEGFQVRFLMEQSRVVWLAEFGNICVAIFLFLSAYGITKSFDNIQIEKQSMNHIVKKTFSRMVVLIIHFLMMYVSVWLIWFSKFEYELVYGDGKQSFLFAITDALGLAEIFDTPTLCMTWWYMEIAILCIAIVPLFQNIYQKIGDLILLVLILLPSVLNVDLDVYMYVIVIAMGLCAANGDWINKLKHWNTPYAMKILLALVTMILSFLLRSNAIVKDYYEYVTESIVAFVWIVGLYILFEKIPLVTRILQFIGKHSMNIFFFHTFIYLILYRDYIYGLEYSGLIFSVLLGISLLYSIVIEFIKVRFGFYKLVDKIKGDL